MKILKVVQTWKGVSYGDLGQFQSKFNLLPMSPKEINTTFTLIKEADSKIHFLKTLITQTRMKNLKNNILQRTSDLNT